MSKLALLQSTFQAHLLGQPSEAILPYLASDNVTVYYNAYRWRLINILREDFPKLVALLGDERFYQMGESYLEQYPSRHFSVRYFGKYLDQFLKETAPFKEHAILSEMAAFEWSLGETLDAPDDKVATIETLQALSPDEWPQMTLQFHASVRTHLFNWDTPLIWKKLEEDPEQQLPDPTCSKPCAWVVWRKDLISYYESLSELELGALSLMQTGATFAQVCEKLCDTLDPDEVPTQAVRFLQHWFHEMMISELIIE